MSAASTLDALATAVWVYDLDEKRVVLANRAASASFGQPSVEALLAVAEPLSAADHAALAEACASLGRAGRVAVRLSSAGRLVTCTPAGSGGSGRRLLVEESSRDRDERLELDATALERMASLVVVIDAAGAIVRANRALCELLGATEAEIAGRKVWEFLGPQHAAIVKHAFETGSDLRAVTPRHAEVLVRAHSGELRLVAWQNALITGGDGRTPLAIGTGTDVTGRREMQGQLLIADRMASIATLAAGVAHGINNPLAYVVANLHELRERLKGTLGEQELAEIAELAAETLDGANRIGRIVGDLRTFSRDEDDRVHAVDLHPIVERALAMAENDIDDRARVVCELDPVPRVLGTESKLAQVILNLLLNAAQAIEPGDVEGNAIVVSTSRDRLGRPKLEIRDSGVGIPAENLGKVFDPFFTTKPLGVGTGLGLSIAHHIVSDFGGEIAISSKLGEGTTVSLVLQEAPAPSPLPARPSTIPPPPTATRRLRILIVDDEPAILRALQRLLSAHDVFRAQSGREAVERIEQIGPFDVVFCDVMMPELSGLDVYREVSERRPGQEQKIVFVTGGAFSEETSKFLDSIPNPKLSKPFEPGAVRALIKSLSS